MARKRGSKHGRAMRDALRGEQLPLLDWVQMEIGEDDDCPLCRMAGIEVTPEGEIVAAAP